MTPTVPALWWKETVPTEKVKPTSHIFPGHIALREAGVMFRGPLAPTPLCLGGLERWKELEMGDM